jgi:hypothetical protein
VLRSTEAPRLEAAGAELEAALRDLGGDPSCD